MCAAGTAHSDHARDIVHALHHSKAEGPYKVRDEAKLRRIAAEC